MFVKHSGANWVFVHRPMTIILEDLNPLQYFDTTLTLNK